MSNRTITHEVKLEKSVKILLGIFAIGVFLNVFSPLLETKPALAEYIQQLGGPWQVELSGQVGTY